MLIHMESSEFGSDKGSTNLLGCRLPVGRCVSLCAQTVPVGKESPLSNFGSRVLLGHQYSSNFHAWLVARKSLCASSFLLNSERSPNILLNRPSQNALPKLTRIHVTKVPGVSSALMQSGSGMSAIGSLQGKLF